MADHEYTKRDGFDVCKNCGNVRNRDAATPSSCRGRTPAIRTREAGRCSGCGLYCERELCSTCYLAQNTEPRLTDQEWADVALDEMLDSRDDEKAGPDEG